MIYFLCKTDENEIQEMFGVCWLNCLPLANMPVLRDMKKELYFHYSWSQSLKSDIILIGIVYRFRKAKKF